MQRAGMASPSKSASIDSRLCAPLYRSQRSFRAKALLIRNQQKPPSPPKHSSGRQQAFRYHLPVSRPADRRCGGLDCIQQSVSTRGTLSPDECLRPIIDNQRKSRENSCRFRVFLPISHIAARSTNAKWGTVTWLETWIECPTR